MEEIVNAFDIRSITVILAVAMLAAGIIGKRMGRRLLQNSGTKPTKFDDASAALLGLLLAFSFGMSIAKHDQRRLAVVADSNAIGDFYTCASLLKEPARTKLQAVIRQYAQARLDLPRGARPSSDLESALATFGQLHTQMTEIVGLALNDGTPIAVSLTNTLNAVTSNQASRLATNPAALVYLASSRNKSARFPELSLKAGRNRDSMVDDRNAGWHWAAARQP